MLSIILLILKIIGIVIASILGLVLLIIALILFAPIRYKIYADYHGKPVARIKVTWLLIIRAKVIYESGLIYRVKVLFFNIISSDSKKKEKKNKKKSKDKQEKASESKEASPVEKTPDKIVESEENKTVELEKKEMDVDSAEEIQETQGEALEVEETFEKEKKKFSIFDFVILIREKIKAVFTNVWGVLNKSKAAADNIKRKVSDIKEKIQDPDNKELFGFLIKQLKKLIKVIKPKWFKVKARLGFEDPAKLGTVLMYVSILYGLTGMDLKLDPVFDQEVKEVTVDARGRIRLISLLIIALKVYRNKQFKKFISR